MCFVERGEKMEYCNCESDETMTASETEMDVEETRLQRPPPHQSPSEITRRLTYAEIVKSGLDSTTVVSPVASKLSKKAKKIVK